MQAPLLLETPLLLPQVLLLQTLLLQALLLLVVLLPGALHLSQAQRQQQEHLLNPFLLRRGLVSQALKCRGCCSIWSGVLVLRSRMALPLLLLILLH